MQNPMGCYIFLRGSSIIALSGLNGHAFGSFKKRGDSFMWLRDALPKDFPQARVLIHGQDTRLVNSTSFQNLLDLGEKFQSNLRAIRAYIDKPIVLIGHSLGGLILKEVRLASLQLQSIENFSLYNLSALRLSICSQGRRMVSTNPISRTLWDSSSLAFPAKEWISKRWYLWYRANQTRTFFGILVSTRLLSADKSRPS